MFHTTLAGTGFTIDPQYPYTEKLFEGYKTEEQGAKIRVSREEIERERTPEQDWPMGYLESLAIYRKICEQLVLKNVLLFHSSAIEFEKKAILFTGPSGTGKTTQTRNWKKVFHDQVRILNGDKPLVKVEPDAVTVFGTPYAGKEGYQTNASAPVRCIVILNQAKENKVVRLSSKEAFPVLLSQTFKPVDSAAVVKTLNLVQTLSQVPIYRLECNLSLDAVKVLLQALQEDQI